MSETPETTADYSGPWYRHSWPWFIVVLLGSTVVAGISTVFIAVNGADSLVSDDYYREGKAINSSLAADREAALREAVASARVDKGSVSVSLDILGDAPAALELELSHVTRAERDHLLRLTRTADGRYASAETLPHGHFYATLRPAGENATWRLRRRIELPLQRTFVLEPSG
jgi:hypothetical protein